jgi:thiol-disulfide isomerase/thioredoxin
LPCREEMPMLSKLAGKYDEKDVAFLAASIDDAKTQPRVAHFLEKKKITLAVFTGATPETLKRFDLGEIVPATLILDRDGAVAFRIEGEASKKDIASRLDWLLSDRSGKGPRILIKHY